MEIVAYTSVSPQIFPLHHLVHRYPSSGAQHDTQSMDIVPNTSLSPWMSSPEHYLDHESHVKNIHTS